MVIEAFICVNYLVTRAIREKDKIIRYNIFS